METMVKLNDYEEIKAIAEASKNHLAVDLNIDGVIRFGTYNKSLISRKINAGGFCRVFLLKGFDGELRTLKERLISEYIFE